MLVKGAFIEFYAASDLLVLAVHCPNGDQSTPIEAIHCTSTVEVFDTGTPFQPGPGWHDWRPAWQATMERRPRSMDSCYGWTEALAATSHRNCTRPRFLIQVRREGIQ